jgi:hypothetical protein
VRKTRFAPTVGRCRGENVEQHYRAASRPRRCPFGRLSSAASTACHLPADPRSCRCRAAPHETLDVRVRPCRPAAGSDNPLDAAAELGARHWQSLDRTGSGGDVGPLAGLLLLHGSGSGPASAPRRAAGAGCRRLARAPVAVRKLRPAGHLPPERGREELPCFLPFFPWSNTPTHQSGHAGGLARCVAARLARIRFYAQPPKPSTPSGSRSSRRPSRRACSVRRSPLAERRFERDTGNGCRRRTWTS